MAARTVKCIVCGEEVSKRRTLLIEGGRACRDHDQVKAYVESKKLEKDMADASAGVRAIVLGVGLRMNHTITGMPVQELYWRIRRRHGEDMEKRVREAVDGHGGPLMTAMEIGSALMDGILMRARLEKLRRKGGTDED